MGENKSMRNNLKKFVPHIEKITEWSLYLLAFFAPFSKSMIEICITVAFISWLLKKILLRDYRIEITAVNVLMVAFVAANLLSGINAELKMLFMRSIVSKCIKFVLLYLIASETINSRVKLKNLFTMAMISASIVMLDAYIQHYYLHKDVFRLYPSFKYAPLTDLRPGYLGFPTGTFPFPNDLAAWMLVILMPVISLSLWGLYGKGRILLGVFTLPFLYLFYLTYARGAWLGFGLALVIMLFMKSRKEFLVFAFVSAFTLFSVISFMPKEKKDELISITSLKDRGTMWQISAKMIKEHPIVGNGLNMYFSRFKELRDDSYKGLRGSYAHNGFLQMIAEIGFLGFTVFILILVFTFQRAIFYIKNEKDRFLSATAIGLLSGIAAFLVHSFFDTNLQSLPLVTLFWFLLGILFSVEKLHAK